MADFERYLDAATRRNTVRSYAAATRHFEVEWGGHLPATANSVARYLADYAERLSVNTLKLRLAALAHWHAEHGFPDPTRAPLVRKVFKGIKAVHLQNGEAGRATADRTAVSHLRSVRRGVGEKRP